ncbi:MAG TPA: YdcH family protein [Thermoanaerobaculia bacterium]|nr:YdcH family protein [Thermoanaerobaculia bacterium]
MHHRDDLRDELLQSDEEFRRLFEEHQDYERRLADLYRKSMPSQDDEIEEKRIKLHKLALKDRMESLLRSRRESRVSA